MPATACVGGAGAPQLKIPVRAGSSPAHYPRQFNDLRAYLARVASEPSGCQGSILHSIRELVSSTSRTRKSDPARIRLDAGRQRRNRPALKLEDGMLYEIDDPQAAARASIYVLLIFFLTAIGVVGIIFAEVIRLAIWLLGLAAR